MKKRGAYQANAAFLLLLLSSTVFATPVARLARPIIILEENRPAPLVVAICTDTNSNPSELRHRQFVGDARNPYGDIARRSSDALLPPEATAFWSCVTHPLAENISHP